MELSYNSCQRGVLTQLTSASFLNKYNIGTAATSKRSLSALVEKELLLETTTLEGTSYQVYNVFLSRWLENL
jgi:hypothetical protein